MTLILKSLAVLLTVAMVLSGCQKPGTYPVSGQECGPEDPVKELDAADCYAPPTGF